MKKILLIEDVPSRQEDFMSEMDFSLLDYDDILENAIGDRYADIEASLKNDDIDFSKYGMLMAHESAFGTNVKSSLEKLKGYCEETETPLVLFSGGASNYYNNSKNEYMELNTKDFYSPNLKVFFDAYREGSHNILMLAYGEKWILNTLLNVLERTNNFLDKNSEDDIVYSEYENFTKIDMLDGLNHSFYDLPIEDGWVYRKDLIALKDSILEYIQEVSNV